MPSPLALALALAALAFPASIAWGNVALALLTAALAVRWTREGQRVRRAWTRRPAIAAALLYAAVGLLCAAWSVAPGDSLREAVKDLHRPWALLVFSGAVALEPAAPILASFGLSLGALACIGISQSLAAAARGGLLARAHAFVHPVVFGEIMALGALGGLCLLLRPREGERQRLVPAFTLLCVCALVLSQTRMALFAAGVGFAAVAWLEPRARRWGLAAALLIAASAGLWELAPAAGRPLSALLRYDPAAPEQARWALWDVAWRIFRDRPWHGAGPDGYRLLFPLYHPAPLAGEARWGSAHNLYLHQLAERGLLGAAALAFLFGSLLLDAFREARRRGDARALWAASSAAALAVMCLTETAFQTEQFAAFFLLLWAWGVTPPAGSAEA